MILAVGLAFHHIKSVIRLCLMAVFRPGDNYLKEGTKDRAKATLDSGENQALTIARSDQRYCKD